MSDAVRLLVPLSDVPPARLLIVDGDALARRRWSGLIESGGHLVEALERGAAALAAARARRPDLVVCGAGVPDMSGVELLERLRALEGCADLPFLLIARSANAEPRLEALERGATDVLSEPVEAAELLARLRNHLQLARELRRWREASFIDPLTGLLNRRGALDCMHREIERARRRQGPLSVLFLDLDGFKAINDRYGHQVGDQVLQRAAHAIAAVVRAGDFAARLGGDEFLVALPGLERAAAGQIALRIERRLGQAARHGRGVRASTGIATARPADAPAARICEELLAAADEEMYGRKRQRQSSAGRRLDRRGGAG